MKLDTSGLFLEVIPDLPESPYMEVDSLFFLPRQANQKNSQHIPPPSQSKIDLFPLSEMNDANIKINKENIDQIKVNSIKH
jgi:hypothetical protein